MKLVAAAALGILIAGPLGGLTATALALVARQLRTRPQAPPPVSLVLLLLLVELRSGLSVLASLGNVARTLPEDVSLNRTYRTARISGLTASLTHADQRLRPVIAQLARSQVSGASLSGVVRRLIDVDLAMTRTHKIAKARALPVKLMLPVTLMMLPGLVLMLYAPSLLAMFDELTGGLF